LSFVAGSATAAEYSGILVRKNAHCYLKEGDKLYRLHVINDAYLKSFIEKRVRVEAASVKGSALDVDLVATLTSSGTDQKVIYDWNQLNQKLYN